MPSPGVVDAHVHFWDPRVLRYPWLDALPDLNRPFAPSDYATATRNVPIDKVVVVECNCAPEESDREVAYFERLMQIEPRLAGIVAFADLTDEREIACVLERLGASPKVKGVRQNIQGQPPGFCLQRTFVNGVQLAGRRGLTFDLCATHDQLAEVVTLVEQCPDTRFVLDHCGKPAIRTHQVDPWRTYIARLAASENVWCKLSGLLTEADLEHWREQDLAPYAVTVLEQFGADRLMYASDWPVLTLAGRYAEWHAFTEHVVASLSDAERQRVYRDNAAQVYEL
jgi:L-fuconolactonase